MGQVVPTLECCHERNQRCGEWSPGQPYAPEEWGSPRQEGLPWVEVAEGAVPVGPESHRLESLSYVPVRFDTTSTFDVERSHARYSKNVVHSTRARTQGSSHAWEELQCACPSRAVTLLGGFAEASFEAEFAVTRTLATYYVDRTQKRLSISPVDDAAAEVGATVAIDCIQTICPATELLLLLDHLGSQLGAAERECAVLLEHASEQGGGRSGRLLFLVETAAAKERFVKALTSVWLDRRNDHSMWF